jgi:hypothetical protein
LEDKAWELHIEDKYQWFYWMLIISWDFY